MPRDPFWCRPFPDTKLVAACSRGYPLLREAFRLADVGSSPYPPEQGFARVCTLVERADVSALHLPGAVAENPQHLRRSSEQNSIIRKHAVTRWAGANVAVGVTYKHEREADLNDEELPQRQHELLHRHTQEKAWVSHLYFQE